MSRLLLLLIGLALLATGAGWVLSAAAELRYWGPAGAELAGLVLLLRNGSIVGTWYFGGILACLTLALVGGLFKIEHWAGADLLLPSGLLGVAVLYSAWFARKPVQNRLAVLKLLWVLAATLGTLGILEHWLPREAAFVAQGLFWLMLLDFVATDHRQRPATPLPRS